jgi:anti-sigma regulatory factor (Ser/Thr protein kinase)
VQTVPHTEQLRFPGTIAGLAEATEALRGFLDSCTLNAARRYRLELAFDEVAGNIVRHGETVNRVDVQIAIDAQEASMTFVDDGIPFDPRQHPPRALSVMSGEAGGLGLPLVRTFASRIDYERTDSHNRLTLAIPLE